MHKYFHNAQNYDLHLIIHRNSNLYRIVYPNVKLCRNIVLYCKYSTYNNEVTSSYYTFLDSICFIDLLHNFLIDFVYYRYNNNILL